MIALESIKGFFPEELRAGQFAKHILKEYVECLALEWIARSQWAPRLTFIGGTNLRLTKDIDRFSEDLDFDCKDLEPDDFVRFTDALVAHLRRNGLNAVSKEKESDRLTSPQIKDYIVRIANATREHPALTNGCSPRASLALMRSSQALAAYNGRDYVIPRDVREMLKLVLTHRLRLKLRCRAEWHDVPHVLDKILDSLKMPNEDPA